MNKTVIIVDDRFVTGATKITFTVLVGPSDIEKTLNLYG